MHGFLRQSTASQTRTIGPFIDDGDFKTVENGLTIANTDIRIKKNGAADVAKNSGGATADVNGLYAVTWDATDTDTVGELYWSVLVSGALLAWGSYTVLEEAVYDALFAASAPGYVANAPVNVAQFGGSNLTAASGIPEVKVASIANDAITAASIAANAIGASEIADGAIDVGAIADGAITAAKIADGAIDAATFAAGAIDASAIADNAIDAGAIASDAITSAKIANDAITAAKIADGAIDAATFAAGAINAAAIADNAIDAGAIAADAITAAKLAADVTTELQNGLATASALSTLDGKVDTVDTVVDAIKVVTDQLTAEQSEPTGVPAANATPLEKIAWQAMLARNKITQTASEQKVFADDGSTEVATSATSDDGVTATRGEFS